MHKAHLSNNKATKTYLSLHRSWRVFQRVTTSFSSSCKLSAPRAPGLRRNKSFTWLFVLSSRDCFSYISSTMVFICFAILSASSLVWGTVSFGRFRWTLSRNWPRLRRLSKCFFTSSRMLSSSAWRSERRTPSRLYRLLISVNWCCTGDSSVNASFHFFTVCGWAVSRSRFLTLNRH